MLLLDEPLGALDMKLRKQMQIELKRMQRRLGITFVFVTHDQDEALAMSDRIAVMTAGRIEQIGTPAEIYDDPADRFVTDFIGSANVFPARVHRSIADGFFMAGRTGRGPGRAIGHLTQGAAASRSRPPGEASASPRCDRRGGLTDFRHRSCAPRPHGLQLFTHYDVRLATGQDVLAYRFACRAAPTNRRSPKASPSTISWDQRGAPRLSPQQLNIDSRDRITNSACTPN